VNEQTLTFENVAALVQRLTPLDKVRLIEQILPDVQRGLLAAESPEQSLAAWRQVYADLSGPDIAQVETIALDRRHFSRHQE